MHEEVRPAAPGDLPALADLAVTALRSAAGRRGGPARHARSGWAPRSGTLPGSVDGLARWAEDPDHVLLAGLIDGVVVGLAAGWVPAPGAPAAAGGGGSPRGPGEGPVGVVECCYVDPEARGVGIGTALAEALVAWFAERGCSGADVPTLPGDRATKQLWEAGGFSARLLVLHRPLR